jgi:hypothetical protein
MQRTQQQPQPPSPDTEPLPPAAQQALARLERALAPRPAVTR